MTWPNYDLSHNNLDPVNEKKKWNAGIKVDFFLYQSDSAMVVSVSKRTQKKDLLIQ